VPIPPPPKPGEQLRYRAIGYTLAHVNAKGRRQVRWEDDSTNYVDAPEVLAFKVGQRFECYVVYTYTGTHPTDPFHTTGPVLEGVNPIADFIPDPAESQRLWDEVTREKIVQPEPPAVDEAFWLKGPKEPK
jgi:hypothetical protein